MNLRYTLTQEDFLKAQDVFVKNAGFVARVSTYALPGIGILLIAAGILNLWNTPRNWGALVFCLIWGMFLLFWRRFSLARSFKKEKTLQERFDVLIDDSGVELSNQNGRTLSRWPAIQRFAESDDLFLLFCGQRTFHLIPKRAFATGEIEQFRTLLKQKVAPRT